MNLTTSIRKLTYQLGYRKIRILILASAVVLVPLILYVSLKRAKRKEVARREETWQRPTGWLALGYCAMLISFHQMIWQIGGGLKLSASAVVAVATLATGLVSLLIVVLTYAGSIRESMRIYRPTRLHLWLFPLISVPLFILVVRETRWLIVIWQGYGPSADSIDLVNQPLWWLFIFGALIPGVAEEFLFRGVIGRGLVARAGKLRGVLFTSALFAMIHIHPIAMINAFLLGVVFHLLFLASGTIIIPIFLHILHNLLILLLASGRLQDFAHFTPRLGSGNPTQAVWMIALVCFVTITALFVFTRRPWSWATPWAKREQDIDAD